jgi:heat shock protein HtpX
MSQSARHVGRDRAVSVGLYLRMGAVVALLLGAPVGAILYLLFGTHDVTNPVGVAGAVVVGTVALGGVQYAFGVRSTLDGVDAAAIDAADAPGLVARVERLADEMDIATPTLYVASLGGPNAFALGRRGSGAVVLSLELLRELDADEVVGVAAHELAHLRHRDSVLMTAATTIRRVVVTLVTAAAAFAVLLAAVLVEGSNDRGRSGVHWERTSALLVGGALVATTNVYLLLTMALSRHREFAADAAAARAVGDHRGLVSALKTIETAARRRGEPATDSATAALCIRGSVRSRLAGLFASHPPTAARIHALERRFGTPDDASVKSATP